MKIFLNRRSGKVKQVNSQLSDGTGGLGNHRVRTATNRSYNRRIICIMIGLSGNRNVVMTAGPGHCKITGTGINRTGRRDASIGNRNGIVLRTTVRFLNISIYKYFPFEQAGLGAAVADAVNAGAAGIGRLAIDPGVRGA